MTHRDVIEVIAKFTDEMHPGWTLSDDGRCFKWPETGTCVLAPTYTESLDALQPVLGRFTPDMWRALYYKLGDAYDLLRIETSELRAWSAAKFYLTLTAAELSGMVAEVIQEVKE